MNDLQVERYTYHNFLNLVIWDGDSGYVHTNWTLCKLYNSEVDFLRNSQGGRFRCYEHSIRSNVVTLSLNEMIGEKSFSNVLEWIAENIQNNWAMSFTDHEAISIGGNMGLSCTSADAHFYFEDPADAVLFLLKFR